jgi:tetratricopeptide (TPR) repeat protein
MLMEEIIESLEAGVASADAVEQALLEVCKGSAEEVKDALAGIVARPLDRKCFETLLFALDRVFRKLKDHEASFVLAYYAGWIAWKNLQDLTKAEFFFRTLGERDEFANDYEAFYCEFYAQRGNFLRLEQFLSERGQKRGESAVETARRLARIAKQFNNQSKELSYWQTVLEQNPDDGEARGRLEALYEGLQRWPSLATLLKEGADRLPPERGEEKIALLKRVIEIYRDKLKIEPKVVATYMHILEIDKANREAIDALLEMFEKAQRWPEYAKILQKKIENTTDKEELIRLRQKQAELMEQKFPNPVELIRSYEAILELAPDREDIMTKLEDLYDKRRDYENFIRMRRLKIASEIDLQAKAKLLKDLAILATERARKVPVAIELWEEVLNFDPNDVTALQNLQVLFEREKNYEKLAEILSRRVEVAKSVQEKVSLLEALAVVYATRLQQQENATREWRRVLELQGTHERAKRELRTYYIANRMWEELEWLFRTYASVDELARTLESQIGSIEDASERQDLLFKLASIWRDELNQPLRAIKNLEQVLTFDQQNLRASLELIDLYKQIGDYKKLPKVYEIAIEGIGEKEKRLALMLEVAKVYRERLKDIGRAFFWFLEAYKENMEDLALREEIEALAGPSDNWDTYVAVLEQAAVVIADKKVKVQTWLRAGEIYSAEVKDNQSALGAYRQAIELDPENLVAIEALENIYTQTENFEDLQAILRRKLALEAEEDKRRAIRLRLASVLYEKLGRVQEAIEVYEEVIQSNVLDFEAYGLFASLLVEEGQFDALLSLLLREVHAALDAPQVEPAFISDLYTQIGVLTWALKGASFSVVDSFAKALANDQRNSDALALAEDLLAYKDLRLGVVGILKGPYASLERFADLADVLEIEIAERGEGSDTLDLLWQLSDLYLSKVGDKEKAFRTYGRIMRITPANRDVWDKLEELALELDGWKNVAELYESSSEAIETAETKRDLLLKLAHVYVERLKDETRALESFHKVLLIEAGNEMALEALEGLYEELGNYEALLDVYRRWSETTPYVGVKKAYAFKMSGVLADKLERTEEAIDAINLVLQHDPSDPAAYRELDRLYTRAKRYAELADCLEKRVELAETVQERCDLRMRLADCLENNLGKKSDAVSCYRVILEDDPAYEPAVVELERLFKDEEVKVETANILLPVYERIGAHEKLIPVYVCLADAAKDVDTRVRYLTTAGKTCEEKLGDLEGAVQHIANAFRTAPEWEDLTSELLRLERLRGRLADAVGILCEKVSDIEDEERRKETHRVIAEIAREIGEKDLSKRHYNEVLQINPEDMPAIDALVSMFEEDGELDPLQMMLKRKAEIVQDIATKVELALRAGQILFEKLGRNEEAVKTFKWLLDFDPSNMRAIEALESLFEKTEKFEELVEILTRKALYATSSEQKVEALFKKGKTLHEHLGNTQEAIDTLNEVLAIASEDLKTMRLLDDLYGLQEDYISQMAILERMLRFIDRAEQKQVKIRIAKLLLEKLGDPMRAVETLGGILEEEPHCEDALRVLEEMVRGGEARSFAFDLVRKALSATQQWERLFVDLEVMADQEEDASQKVALLLEMGDVASRQLKEPLRAFEAFKRALGTSPTSGETVQRLQEIAMQFDLWGDLPDTLEHAADAIEGTQEGIELRLLAGSIRRDRLNDMEGAATCFEGILKVAQDNKSALEALDALYGQLGRYQELARILLMRSESASGVDEKVGFLLRHGDVAEQFLGKPELALESRREVLYLVPGHEGAARALRAMLDAGKLRVEIAEILEPIYRANADFEALATMLERCYDAYEDPAERRLVLLKLGEVYLENMGRKGDALKWFGEAFVLDPEDDNILAQIEGLAQETSDFAKLQDELLRGASAAQADERRVFLWHKAASCALEKLQDLENAEAIYKWILDINEGDMTALQQLDKLYESSNRWTNLLDVLEREARHAETDYDKVNFYLRIARLQREKLNDIEGAIDAYLEAHKSDETNRDALTGLLELFEVQENYQEIFKTLGKLADLSMDKAQRSSYLRKMAEIAEFKLGLADDALKIWDEVSGIDPEDSAPLRQLQRLYRAKGDWDAFVDVCERELPLVQEDRERQVMLLQDIALAGEKEIKDEYLAEHAYKRILDIDPENRNAMLALCELFRKGEEFDRLSEILYKIESSSSFGVDEVLPFYEEHARLLTEELVRPEEAVTLWNKVLDSKPRDIEAMKALEGLYETTAKFDRCVEIMKRRAELETDVAVKAEVLHRAAQMEADQLQNLEASAATLKEVLSIAPERLETFSALRDLYLRLQDYQRLADLLLELDKVLKDEKERAQNLAELSQIYETKLGVKDAAFLVMVKAVQLVPNDDFLLQETQRLAEETRRFEDYVGALEPVLHLLPEGAQREHLLRFGRYLWKDALDAKTGARYYERVLERWPEDEDSLEALSDIYAEIGRFEDLVQVLKKRVEISKDNFTRVSLETKAAEVLEREIKDIERAIEAYRKVLDFDEEDVNAWASLVRLYEEKQDYKSCVWALEHLASLDIANEATHRLRVARILEEKLSDKHGATKAYEAVLDLQPSNMEALNKLQALYGEEENWKGLAQVFERLLDVSQHVADKILFCNRLGLLYEQALKDKQTALDYYRRAFDMDPSDDETFEICVRLMLETEDYYGAVSSLEMRVAQIEDRAAKVSFLERIAEIQEHRTGDINAAISVYERILDIEPSHLPAYSHLVRLFKQMEAWEGVVKVMLQWKEHVEEDEFVQLMLEAAEIYRKKLEQPERALQVLDSVLAVAPLNEKASAMMRAIYEEFGDYEKVANTYLRQAEHAPSEETKGALLALAADVFLMNLKDKETAVQYYEKALSIYPKMRDTQFSLAKTYVEMERWEKALPLLEMQMAETDATAEPRRVADLHFQLGLCAEKLLDYDTAMREYKAALSGWQEHVGALLGFARLYRNKGLWQISKDHFEKALGVVEQKAQEVLSERDLVEIYYSLAEVSLKLDDLEDATRYLNKLLELAPDYVKAIEALISIGEKKNDFASVIRYKQELVRAKQDPFEKFALLLEIGDLYKDKLHNPYGAQASYEEALTITPNAKVAILKLFELFLELDDVHEAVAVLERLALAEENPTRRAEHYAKIAALMRTKLKDNKRAVDYLNMALDADSENLLAFRAIDEILTEAKDWSGQAENYRKMIERIKDRGVPDSLMFRLYFNLGEIYRSRLHQYDYALSAFGMAEKIRPDDIKTHEILAELYEKVADQSDKAIEEYRAIVMARSVDDESVRALRSMLRLFKTTQQFDKALITASVLHGLGKADESEAEFYKSNVEPSLPRFEETVDNVKLETHLVSPTESLLVGHILEVLFQGLASELGARGIGDYGLKKKNEVDLSKPLFFNNIYRAVVRVLQPVPHKVYRDDGTVGLKIVFTYPPGLVAGPDMFTEQDEREMAFLLGSQVMFLHPMHFLASVNDLTTLKLLMAASLKFARPETEITAAVDVIRDIVKRIDRKMPQRQKQQLAKLISDLVAREPDADFGRILGLFFTGMERTALRAGVLMCGDTNIALRGLSAHEGLFPNLNQRERVEEVVRFSLSDDHFILRKALGVAIENLPKP